MPTTLTRKPTLTAVLALTAGLALAFSGLTISAAAATNTVEINSRIIMRESFPAFHGRVKSPNDACEDNRLVKLFKKKRSGGRKLLGKTHTDVEGKWEIIVDPLRSGSYRAVVKQRAEGTAGTTFVCLRDKSKRAVVD
jgi:hypothetical protein